jgi:GntR family transcriptional regulator/MocR family aminotransferase
MELVFEFDRTGELPLYRSLSNAIKEAITDGRLPTGEKIPSVRALCELAQVSRNTAHQCYQTLIDEGYIEAIHGRGAFVRKRLDRPGDQPNATAKPAKEISGTPQTPMIQSLMRLEESISTHARTASTLNHQMPSLEDLPLQPLKRALAKYAKLSDPALLAYSGDPFGHPLLREAIAGYVLRARGIKCGPDQIVVTSRPSQQLLDLFCRLFLVDGDRVAVEHPGYSQPRQIFELHNAQISLIPVDDDGIKVDGLAAGEAAKIVYVTPSHQDPTGAILSLQRRKQLLHWAHKNDAMIWEDDVENEYRYGSDPIAALYALDNDSRVIYQSTFWRTLCPVIRLGFVILPANRTQEIVHHAKYLLDRDLPIMEQLALADLINEGHFERHVRAMRNKFASRRQTAVHKLTIELGEMMSICRNTSGLHLRALFDPAIPKEIILQSGNNCGLPITSTAAYYVENAPENEFLIQFAHTNELELERQIHQFAEKLQSARFS